MRFKISFVSISFFVLMSFLALNTTTYAQGKDKVVEQKSMKSRGSDKDQNIKVDKFHNNPDMKKMKKKKSRASNTTVIVKNTTGWYIKVYNDGYYQGTISPYGSGYFNDYGDVIKLYARADFDDGSYRYWGPKYVRNDDYYKYTWRLTY